VYQTIPRMGDSANPPEPTPPEIAQRVALLHTSYNELKDDMLDEVAKVETMLVQPLGECKVCDPMAGIGMSWMLMGIGHVETDQEGRRKEGA